MMASIPVMAEDTVPPSVSVPTIKETGNIPDLKDITGDITPTTPPNPSNPNPPDTTPPVVTPPVIVPPVKPTEPVIEVVVKGSFEATGSYQIPLSELKEVDKLEIKGDISMIFDSKALEKIGITGALEVTAKPVAVTALDETLKKQIGDRPIYEFKVAVDGTPISQFGGGSITVSIPYTLKAGENPNAILVYYLDANGKVKTMKSKYENGQVTFTTNHFSKYAVGYNPITFSDVSEKDWYFEFVSYLSSRGLVNGKSPLSFSPSAQITRAEVVTILSKMSGEELTTPKAAVFKDVKATDWFAASVYWAYKKGIIAGMSDMTFAPNQPISRQDLTVILAKYLEKVELTSLEEGQPAITFKDASEIAPYAKESVTTMQRAGILNGKANNTFDPKGNATRAEVTKVLTLLLKSLIQ